MNNFPMVAHRPLFLVREYEKSIVPEIKINMPTKLGTNNNTRFITTQINFDGQFPLHYIMIALF